MEQLKIINNNGKFNPNDRILQAYLNEVAKTERISPEEEVALAKRIKEGDETAIQELTKANLGFVVSVAKQYQNQGLPLNDLINEGNIGLIEAARRFDPSHGFKFISYAVWWIRQGILRALHDYGSIVPTPSNIVLLSNKFNEFFLNFTQENHREPTPIEMEEYAKELATTQDIALTESLRGLGAWRRGNKHVSLDQPLGDDPDGGTLIDFLSNEDDLKGFYFDEALTIKEDIEKILSVLGDKEADILKMFFGIGYDYPMSTNSIARELNLTVANVRNLKARAINKLKNSFRTQNL